MIPGKGTFSLHKILPKGQLKVGGFNGIQYCHLQKQLSSCPAAQKVPRNIQGIPVFTPFAAIDSTVLVEAVVKSAELPENRARAECYSPSRWRTRCRRAKA